MGARLSPFEMLRDAVAAGDAGLILALVLEIESRAETSSKIIDRLLFQQDGLERAIADRDAAIAALGEKVDTREEAIAELRAMVERNV